MLFVIAVLWRTEGCLVKVEGKGGPELALCMLGGHLFHFQTSLKMTEFLAPQVSDDSMCMHAYISEGSD